MTELKQSFIGFYSQFFRKLSFKKSNILEILNIAQSECIDLVSDVNTFKFHHPVSSVLCEDRAGAGARATTHLRHP